VPFIFKPWPPKWSRLNKVAGLFEYEVDAEGNTHNFQGRRREVANDPPVTCSLNLFRRLAEYPM
jgi:hypothetical protein